MSELPVWPMLLSVVSTAVACSIVLGAGCLAFRFVCRKKHRDQ